MKKINQLLLLILIAVTFSCNNQKKESNETIIEKPTDTKAEKIIVQDSIKTKTQIVTSVVNVSSKKENIDKIIEDDVEPKREQVIVQESIVKTTTKVTSEAKSSSKKATALEIFYKENEKKSQFFYTNNDKDTTIVCAEKTKITIHGNSFVSSKTGKAITGKVQISVKEYYKMSDILLAKLSTTSDGKLLESGGMINIIAKSGDDECELKVGKTIEIEFPTQKGKEGMQLFSGIKNEVDEINWVLDEEAIPYNQDFSNTVDELAIFPGGNMEMRNFIAKNFKLIDEGVTGKIDVTFVVDTDGTVKDVKIKRGVSVAMDKEAKRVVKLFPKFKPGKLKGVPVSTTQTIPIYIYMDATDDVGSEWFTKVDIKENFENNYKDDTAIKNAKPKEINSYLLSSTQLGMINCDRFLNDKENEKIEYTIQFNNNTETSVNIVFHSIKSFMSQSTDSEKVSFKNVPKGEKITIIAIKYIDEKPFLAVKDSDISLKLENGLVFQPVTLESLKSEMKKLDRFN